MNNRHRIIAVNVNDRDWKDNRYVLSFGAYGWTRLLVWANHLEDALDECIDWISDNAPGLLRDEQVYEAYNEAILSGKSEEEAFEDSIVDMTCGGNNSHYITSWEWCILAENPTNRELVELAKRG